MANLLAPNTQEVDEFALPSDDAPEPRPRPPAAWDGWLRRTRRIVNLWALVYDDEWCLGMSQRVASLERLHEDHPTVFPDELIMDVREEFCWRFLEGCTRSCGH